MERRDVLKLLGSAVAVSALPQEAMALLQVVSGQVGRGAGRTMDAHQNATVTTIAELIIPETDTPGAKGARVNEFIDLLLTEWYEPAETRQFLDGVKAVDTESQKRFSAVFVDCKPAQQMELMKGWDMEAMGYARGLRTATVAGALKPEKGNQLSPAPSTGQEAAASSVPAAGTGVPVGGQAPKPAVTEAGQTDAGIAMGSGAVGGSTAPVNFFYLLKKLTLTGYYTSQIGFEKELGKMIIPAAHSGCAPVNIRKAGL